MTTVSNLTVNVDVSDEVLELIANLQSRVDSLEPKSKTPFEKARDSGEFNKFFSDVVASGFGLSEDDYCSCDACNRGEESEPQPFVVIDGTTYINSSIIKDGMIAQPNIGSMICSEDYVERSCGWALNKESGDFEINAKSSPKHVIILNNKMRVFDECGICRVECDLS